MSERRRAARSLCAELMHLEWRDAAGKRHVQAGVLEDISARGACVQTESPISVPCEVRVSNGTNWTATCWAVYCVYRDIGYYVGLEFEAGARWSASVFRPKHLLDLHEFAGSYAGME